MKIVKSIVDNKEVNVRVEESAPFSKRVACANIIAESVVDKDGVYLPWMYKLHYVIFILSAYTDFTFPAEWGDNEMIAFSESESFKNVEEVIRKDELEEVAEWAHVLIEYRKKCYESNAFTRLLNDVKGVMKTIGKELKEDPEIIGMLNDFISANKLQ